MNPPTPMATLAMPIAHVVFSHPHGFASICPVPSLNSFCSSVV